MSYQHIYDPFAFLEFKDAIAWYAERSEKAALNLIKKIKQKIAVICKDPFRYRNTYKKFRETSLAKYPYSIIYLIDENTKTVIITSVYHHKKSVGRKFKK